MALCITPLPHLDVEDASLHERVAVFGVAVGGVEGFDVVLGV